MVTNGSFPEISVYLTSANVLFLSFFAFSEINKLRVISEAQNSDCPRLHHFSPLTHHGRDVAVWVCLQPRQIGPMHQDPKKIVLLLLPRASKVRCADTGCPESLAGIASFPLA
jgi:hypothetical protein